MNAQLQQVLAETVRCLREVQCKNDGPGFFAGEFPMTARCPERHTDYNFLSGYALLHVAVALKLCEGFPRNRLASELDGIVVDGGNLTSVYQTARGSSNWYHGKLSGDNTPTFYDWPDGVVLSLHDDLDDSAISVMLCRLHPAFRHRVPVASDLFTRWAYNPSRDVIGVKSQQRLRMGESSRDVYMTWPLPGTLQPSPVPAVDNRYPKRVKVPTQNSIELVTAANIFTAVRFLGEDGQAAHTQRATRHFVNRLAQVAIRRLLADHDASVLDMAAAYYPRAPFAPLSYLLRDHWLTDRSLLHCETLRLIASAVEHVDSAVSMRENAFAAPLYWLNCAGWCIQLDLLTRHAIEDKVQQVIRRLSVHPGGSEARLWPDFVFFMGAHIGAYSGQPYSQALVVETLSLLLTM